MNDNSLLPLANYFQLELQKAISVAIAVDQDEAKAEIDLVLVNSSQAAGYYSLKIEPARVTITATDSEGIFYGLISLLQLIKGEPSRTIINLRGLEISDAPRYQWRGFMLDESRHFFGKKKVEQLLEWMAFYKLNKFHWHLTDVDGWRLEIKKYPRLTSLGGMGNHSDTLAAAKYYTQDDIKEIVAYAHDRFITVIPEIDMPGHATAANRAYPEFSGGSIPRYENFTFDPSNEKTYQFLADILKEAGALFPSQMIHLGGDEVALGIQAWIGRPAIMALMAKNKFNQLSDLEHYFFRRMADTVISTGSKVLCWDEAADNDLPAAKTIIFWWRQNVPSSLRTALQKKYDVVLCPRLPLYFDFVESKNFVSGRKWNGIFNGLGDVYNFPDRQMSSDILHSSQILGIQANLWTETIASEKRLDFMTFPRITALAEAAWTDSASKNEASFDERLKSNLKLYDNEGIYYFNPFNPAVHPEAIDFAPNLMKPVIKAKHDRHRRKAHGRHHNSAPVKHAKGRVHTLAKHRRRK